MVLLDDVQFPFGVSWLTRNRLKSDKGELWLRVPVWRKGRGKQAIRDVEICYEEDWIKKHLRSIGEQYSNAPYKKDIIPELVKIYESKPKFLVEFNIQIIRFLLELFGIPCKIILQSEVGVQGSATDLLVSLCNTIGATKYKTLVQVHKYHDETQFKNAGVRTEYIRFVPPKYPQLWGDFIENLSGLDLYLNCGPRSFSILQNAIRPECYASEVSTESSD
ncbi:MAG TPA: WbqC family protein [Acidobacteriota bacterium]|nr:WbqC family protein [Acidobacteriota bacterium]